MRSLLQKKSYGSVKVFWFDRELALYLAKEACRKIISSEKDVVKVGIFGSVAKGNAAPGSDLDILIVVKECALKPLERSERFLPYFKELDIGVDLFCYTLEEAKRSSFFQENAKEAIWVCRAGHDLSNVN